MKTLTRTIAATALIASFAAPTFASVQQDIIAAAGTNGNIQVQVVDDTVVLTGYVDDTLSQVTAERVAESQGFEVQNHLLIND